MQLTPEQAEILLSADEVNLAAQVKEVVEALAQAAANAQAERAVMRRLVRVAIVLAVISTGLGVWALAR